MLSSRLSERMKTKLNPDDLTTIENYVNSLSYATKITVERAARALSFDRDKTKRVLQVLVKIGALQRGFYIRCPECGLIVESVDSIDEINTNVYCYNCEEDVDIDGSDVEEIFFLVRNSNELAEEFPDSYSLLSVDKKLRYGVSQGKLLYVAGSIDELNEFAEKNGFDNKLLRYVTGENLA